MQVVHYLELKQYNWVGLRDIPRLRDKVKRVASQVSQVLTKKWRSSFELLLIYPAAADHFTKTGSGQTLVKQQHSKKQQNKTRIANDSLSAGVVRGLWLGCLLLQPAVRVRALHYRPARRRAALGLLPQIRSLVREAHLRETLEKQQHERLVSFNFLAKASIKASICQDRLGTASQLQRSLELKQRERDFEHVFPPHQDAAQPLDCDDAHPALGLPCHPCLPRVLPGQTRGDKRNDENWNTFLKFKFLMNTPPDDFVKTGSGQTAKED
jgi:hypothetical protein